MEDGKYELSCFSCNLRLFLKTQFFQFRSKCTIVHSVRWNKCPPPEALGNFELLLDEELVAQEEKEYSSGKYRSSSSKWK